ncbi:MAG: hypothetical protein J6X32_02105 [Salinivirgaceae bacterium]|nr:hypothetical protein [Salinivirgaceae bacterium]
MELLVVAELAEVNAVVGVVVTMLFMVFVTDCALHNNVVAANNSNIEISFFIDG